MLPDLPTAKIIGAKCFTFAVVADTHLEPEAGQMPRSNRRTRAVIERLRADAPAFVLHLGDLVHPVPALPGFTGAAQAVCDAFGLLECPVYMTPGNHDIGDKPLAWMPAKSVTSEWIESYRHWFGAPFQSFSHDDCQFILVNTPAFNSGLPFEAEQKQWLEAELAAHKGQRLFLATHYPPYLLQPDEPSSYDNLDEPARVWFLALLERFSVEALFVGHVHNFFYTLHRPDAVNSAGMDFYALPSTSFVRRDYSELFRIAPDAEQEFGRNDAGKLGYFLVDVHEQGHLARPVRSEEDAPEPGRRLRGLHPVEAPAGGLGVHLRHPWGEVVALPHNPPTDEFQRRRVRNDYTLMACWELGLRNLRVPLADLADGFQRAQMHSGVRLGLRFTVFSAGLPTAQEVALVAEQRHLVTQWELILPWDDPAALAAPLRELRQKAGVPLLLARLRTAGADLGGGSNLKHFTWAGFSTDEAEALAEWLRLDGLRDVVDALLFRVPWEADALEVLPAIAALGEELEVGTVATVCLAPDDPSAATLDDLAIANRVASAQFLGATFVTKQGAAGGEPNGKTRRPATGPLPVFLDTFADIDRGYFVRNGLVDRQYNPRLAGWVYRNLQRALADLPPLTYQRHEWSEGLDYLVAEGEQAVALLLLPTGEQPVRINTLPDQLRALHGPPPVAVWLDSGELSPLNPAASGYLNPELPVTAPVLLIAGQGAIQPFHRFLSS